MVVKMYYRERKEPTTYVSLSIYIVLTYVNTIYI